MAAYALGGSVELCHVFGTESDLRMDFQNLGVLTQRRGAQKLCIFG